MNVAADWRRRWLHFLLPAHCLSCQDPLWGRKAAFGLCPSCRARLGAAPSDGVCRTCGAPEVSSLDSPLCPQCRSAPRSYRRLLWGWNYAPPFDAVVTGLKFRRLDYLGRELGAALAERFADEIEKVDVISPVPLGWLRRLGRGYNQAEEIATTLARKSAKKMVRLLSRRRATRPQSLATLEERRRNLAGAFAPTRALATQVWQGSHVLLVDDVFTSGATLEAAAHCLLAGGAGEVTALVAARTPSPEQKATSSGVR